MQNWLIASARLAWLVVGIGALAALIVGLPLRADELNLRFADLVGLEVKQSRAGDILLSPLWNRAASRGGILEGDVLVSIDGSPADLASVEALPDGALGQQIELGVRTGDRPQRNVVVTRGGESARVLAPLQLSAAFVSRFALSIEVIAALVSVVTAAWIFWRRPRDWRAILVSATCLMLAGMSAPVVTLYTARTEWRPIVDLWWAVGLAAFILFFYLFPDGRFVPRWTGLVAVMLVVWTVAELAFPALYPWRLPRPFDFWLLFGLLCTGIAAQAYRYARVSDTVQRQQAKWVAVGAALAGSGVLIAMFLPRTIWPIPTSFQVVAEELVVFPAARVLESALPVSIGFALLRYRLWDVDVVIRRALVYATLTASVVGLYVLVVGSLGAVFRAQSNLLVSLLATGFVAVLFQPLRDRLQRGVNHLLYGQRDEPYAVLSRLGQRLEATLAPEAVMPSIVDTVREALKLPYAAIHVHTVDGEDLSAFSGQATDHVLRLPLIYQHEHVGELQLATRGPGEGWSPADRRLLGDLARQAGIAAHTLRLTVELQRSRERLVTTREEERRRLRRDLHDELAPTLAALALSAAAARDRSANDPATASRLDELYTGLRGAVADIRRLVYDLRPPAVDELGLVGAIRERAAAFNESRQDQSQALQVRVESPDHLPPLPAAVEVAAYRIAQEALMNVARHAGAHTCTIRLALNDGLELEISDDGRGLPETYRAGVGLGSMRARALELGGQCTIERRNGAGTSVRAWLPIAREVSNGAGAYSGGG